ncbi:unnamed protein product [Durusdinium trenchii]|uniref:Uncharacterized protein n=1 Tax=Durusdinium trenchii TaxID=1381693 RepID=A0ABP0LEH6_9DINO
MVSYVTVNEGSSSKVYTGGVRPADLLCMGITALLLILVPLLFICDVRVFFGSSEQCSTGYTDVCSDKCASLLTAQLVENQGFCCTSCPSQLALTNLQCGADNTRPAPPHVHTVVRRHYNTVYHKVPVNHYVHVQMPEKAPIVHTVQVQTPARHYSCDGMGSHPDPSWSSQHTRWCCYKYKMYCPVTVVDKDYYHTVTNIQPVRVPVPEPMPAHAPIIHTIHHTYHVPSPPQYVHVQVPGPTVVKPVVMNENVPVPVPEPPQVINVKRPYPVHVQGPDHYVKVPVPSPPHVVTHYHTQWNTVVDQQYDCQNGLENFQQLWSHSKQTWCCSHFNSGCGHWEKVVHVYHSYDCQAGFSNWYHGWSSNKKDWCCSHQQRGCPGTWHGHYHVQAGRHPSVSTMTPGGQTMRPFRAPFSHSILRRGPFGAPRRLSTDRFMWSTALDMEAMTAMPEPPTGCREPWTQ